MSIWIFKYHSCCITRRIHITHIFQLRKQVLRRWVIYSSHTANRNRGDFLLNGSVYHEVREVIHYCHYLHNGHLQFFFFFFYRKSQFHIHILPVGINDSSFLLHKDYLLIATRWREIKSERQQLEKVIVMSGSWDTESRGPNGVSTNLNRMKILKSLFVHPLLIFTFPEIKLQVYFTFNAFHENPQFQKIIHKIKQEIMQDALT